MRLFILGSPPDFHPPERTLKLIINGQEKQIESSRNLTELLQELDITGPHVAIALNLQVVPRSRYDETGLNEGDKVEIVHAVGGG